MIQSLKTASEMYPLIERYLEGHKTQKAFCAEHHISSGQLNYWLAKYRREHADDAFVEIMPTSAPAEQALMEVVYPHGVCLRLFSPVAPAYLERLLGIQGT
jgi:hypothetical protein